MKAGCRFEASPKTQTSVLPAFVILHPLTLSLSLKGEGTTTAKASVYVFFLKVEAARGWWEQAFHAAVMPA